MENVTLKRDTERAQAVIIAAFLVAIGVLVLSVFLNGLIFSQNLATRDDGAVERNIMEFNQGTEEAVRTAMTGNRTTPADAEEEFDLFMSVYEERIRDNYARRQSAVSLGPTGSDSNLNLSDVSSSTLAWAIGQRCNVGFGGGDCNFTNATGSPDWNAIENNTGSSFDTGIAFDSPRKFVFTVKQPSSSTPKFQVDAVRNGNAPKDISLFSPDTTEGDWRMLIDDDEIKFQRVDSLIPSTTTVLLNTTTVEWSDVDGDTARIDILNESIDGESVTTVGNASSPTATPSTYPDEVENDPDKNYLRFWDGDVVEGTYDVRLDDAAGLENDITGPCDAPCSVTSSDRGIYAFGVVHEVEGVRANYAAADATHTSEIDVTLRQEDLILEDR